MIELIALILFSLIASLTMGGFAIANAERGYNLDKYHIGFWITATILILTVYLTGYWRGV